MEITEAMVDRACRALRPDLWSEIERVRVRDASPFEVEAVQALQRITVRSVLQAALKED